MRLDDSLTKVQNSITGYVSVNNNLKYCRKTNVVVRSDIECLDPSAVRIITGGGSGHEPAHLGYVGEGMLTAAVCGEVFASPSVSNILAAIVSVARPGTSVLLIVKNYTGDRLNFGLAGEIAKTKYGYKVETLLVDDDCAIENVREGVGKRGLAGTVLIHKIAGAMAHEGLDLMQIHNFCNNILKHERLATVGFTFNETGDSLKEIEIGRGIHGEAGILNINDEQNFDNIIEILSKKLLKKVIRNYPNQRPEIILMFNNLGGTSNLTMSIFSNLFLNKAKIDYDIRLILEGTFMTSLKQEGISVTVLRLLDEDKAHIIEYIKRPIKIAANVPFNIIRDFLIPDDYTDKSFNSEHFLEKINYDERSYRIKHNQMEFEACETTIIGVCNMLILSEKRLNTMDAEFGDGDTGTLIVSGAKSILEAVQDDRIDFTHPAVMLYGLSEVLQKNMGGSLGALLSIYLQAAAEAFTLDQNEIGPEKVNLWLLAIKFGIRAVQKYGLAELGDRTMIDALQPGVDILEKRIKENASLNDIIQDLAAACEQGANSTKLMIPKSGRAAYVFSDGKEFKAEWNDPGAQVVAVMAQASFVALKSIFNKHGI